MRGDFPLLRPAERGDAGGGGLAGAGLLLCLMAVVAGLQSCGLFGALAGRLLTGRKSLRLLATALILLPFFCSMLVTNDVALLVFVPFSILVLSQIGRREHLIPVVVLQTLAANLGSMGYAGGQSPKSISVQPLRHLAGGLFRHPAAAGAAKPHRPADGLLFLSPQRAHRGTVPGNAANRG